MMGKKPLHIQCPNGHGEMEKAEGQFGPYYRCPLYASRKCDMLADYHTGAVSDQSTRNARKAAHSLFDQLWKGQRAMMSRSEAYRWLQEQTGLGPEVCHIKLFTIPQCQRVIELVKGRFAR
ncbi:MAG: zinc-finger-containing protein [Armatimonadota bacterium]